jgi:hypothetical protein
VFLVAFRAQGLARWNCAERDCNANTVSSKAGLTLKLLQEALHYEGDATIENPTDFYWQMDPQSFVLTEREVLSARPVAPSHWHRLPEDAYENSSQSRIQWTDCPARDEFTDHRRRVFLDQAGTNDHHSAQRHVPLGQTTRLVRQC